MWWGILCITDGETGDKWPVIDLRYFPLFLSFCLLSSPVLFYSGGGQTDEGMVIGKERGWGGGVSWERLS